MNERINELLQQARDYINEVSDANGVYQDKEYPHAVREKFAELIVRECAEYLSTTDYSDVAGDHNRALEIAAIDILEHFGVE